VVGTTIGKYLVTAQLGRGSTGVLYKAVDPTLNRDVAIKVLRSDGADEETRQRFRAETAVLARLNHPDIVTIYEFLETDTDLVMVMEFVAGESLEGFARRSGPLALDIVAYLIDRLLSALEYAHRFGIVHRDLKPANVMITNVGGIKVMDFGIARVCASQSITLAGSMMGTPGYMAPEQILGRPADIRADVYAVGAILYRLLAGEGPFEGGTTAALIQRQLSEQPTALRSRRPDVTEAYPKVVMRAMAKAPGDRFRTTDELREALGRVSGMSKAISLSKRLVRECPADSTLISALQPPPAAKDAPKTFDTVRLHRHNRRKAATAMTLLAAAVIMGLLVSVNSQNAPGPAIAATSVSTTPAGSVDDRPESSDLATRSRVSVAPVAEPSTNPPPSPTPPSSGIPAAAALNGSRDVVSGSTASSSVPAASKPPRKSADAGASARHEPGAAVSAPTSTHVEEHAASNAAASSAVPAAAAAAPPTAVAVDERPADATVTRGTDPNFKAKFLAVADAKARETDVRLTLGNRALTLVASDDSGRQLQTVDYATVTAVSYSVGRDPLWQSQDGPAPVLRRGGMLRKFGFSGARHWIVLSTGSDSFVVLQVNEDAASSVLSLIEDHTGLRSQRLTDNNARPRN